MTKADRIIRTLTALGAPNGDGPLDFVLSAVASGKTIHALAEDVTAALGEPVRRDALSRVVSSLPGARERLPDARLDAAHAFAEESLALADTAGTDSREAIQKAQMRIASRQWMAERFNRAVYGGPKGVEVNISIGQMHLAALQRHTPAGPGQITDGPVEPMAADFEVLPEG